jgi:hypothetical protein
VRDAVRIMAAIHPAAKQAARVPVAAAKIRPEV